MDNNPKAKGERSEGQVLAAFLRAGKVVLTPYGDSQRYDFVLDDNGKFLRVQVKTGRVVGGSIRFPCCSNNWYSGTRTDYRGQVEVFAVYVPTLDKVYLVPVDEVGVKEACLRLEPTRSNQKEGVRFAADYEFRGC